MVTPLKIAFVEWPDALSIEDAQWSELKDAITAARPDILVTNELPFGPWLAEGAVFSEAAAHLGIRVHENGLKGLIDLNVPQLFLHDQCGTENGLRTRRSWLKTESYVRYTGNSIFRTSRDGLSANGTRATVRVLRPPTYRGRRSVCFCARKRCSTDTHGPTEGKTLP
jgi:hypothetical protein